MTIKTKFFFINKLFLQILVFVYVYNVFFIGLPFGLGSRQVLGLVGFFLLLKKICKNFYLKEKILIKKNLIVILSLVFSLFFIALLSVTYNDTNDLTFIRYSFGLILSMLSAYFVLSAFKCFYGELSIQLISVYFLNAVFFQVLLSATMFFNPVLYDFMNSLQNIDGDVLEKLKAVGELRIMGFGTAFFESGVINGYALMLIPTLLRSSKKSTYSIFYATFIFLIISVVGMMMARTTIIGAVIALLLFFVPLRYNKIYFSKIIFRFFIFLFTIPVLIFFGFNFLSNELKNKITFLTNYGFELFLNYIDGKGFSSSSTDEMKEMYVWPSSLKTYFIGDGYFIDPLDSAFYYMGSDIGYIRLLYYFGAFGLLSFVIINCYVLKIAFDITHNLMFKVFFVFSAMYLLVLNFKGFTDIFYLSILIGLVAFQSKKGKINI